MKKHSAEVIWNYVRDNKQATQKQIVEALPQYARTTVNWKIRLLERLQMLVKVGPQKEPTYTVLRDLDMDKVRKAIAEANEVLAGRKGARGKETEASKLRRQMRNQGTDKPYSQSAFDWQEQMPAKAAELNQQVALHSTSRAKAASSAVDIAVEAVGNVPVKDLSDLRKRLQGLLG